MTTLSSDLPLELEEPLHPVFLEAIDKLLSLNDKSSDDPEVRDCVIAAIVYAPKALQGILFAEYRRQGILPMPDFYTEDAQGLHDIEKAAQHSGLSVTQLKAELQKLAEKYPDGVLSDKARKNGDLYL